ncbi:hypothetical protein [Absidia glauca]|uniref:Uncharacterized protein n=1 Tax=Absidia glauca TaxID=4829 RepID=A0A163K3C3_ABSGL|nr:hypothetical protein [Absidia glauca]
MLREKSSNTPLTTWLSQSGKRKQSASTSSTTRSERGYENNKEKEEEDLQRAIEQSRKDYRTQQKQQYDKLSSLYSTASSASTYMIPSIDDDDAWFQSTPPKPATSPVKRPKLSLTTKRSPSSKGKGNSDRSIIPPASTTSPKLANKQVDDGQDTAPTQVLKKEEDEESWTIEEDESWEIQSSEPEVKTDPSAWEINADDDMKTDPSAWEINADDDITPPDDEMDEYMSAIRNRSTKTIPSSKQQSIQQEAPTGRQQQQKRRPATLLDDVFSVITKDQDSPRPKKKSKYVNAETNPAYNPPKIYQTLFDSQKNSTNSTDQRDKSTHTTADAAHSPTGGSLSATDDDDDDEQESGSDCSSIIDLCMDEERGNINLDDQQAYSPIDFSFFDDDNDLTHDSNDLESLPFADDDDFDASILDQHPFEIDDDDDEQYLASSNAFSTPTPTTTSNNVASTTNSMPTAEEEEEEDSGYLSPLEGFVSLLDQSRSNSLYRPYFDQLTNAIMEPSSSRTPSTSSEQRSTRRPRQRTGFRKYPNKRGGYSRR